MSFFQILYFVVSCIYHGRCRSLLYAFVVFVAWKARGLPTMKDPRSSGVLTPTNRPGNQSHWDLRSQG